jgi:hypothetical protein
MKSMIVFESMYGNTRQIAEAVGAVLIWSGWETQLCNVADAPVQIPADIDLLVVGAPTHAFTMSRPSSRANAGAKAEVENRSLIGVREWIAGLVRPQSGTRCVVFDTRFAKPRWLTGSAAVAAARALRRYGVTTVADAASFYVTAATGPLAAGELARAQRWVQSIAGAIAATSAKAP